MEWYMMSASKDFETIIFEDLISFFDILGTTFASLRVSHPSPGQKH